MPNYRRSRLAGGGYFFTVVTHERRPWLCEPFARTALREAIERVRTARPFDIDAWVLLPDHLHCIWTLPEDDRDFSTRWRLIKAEVSKRLAGTVRYASLTHPTGNGSRSERRERDFWQRRFWEHTIRDDADFAAHCDYIHYNSVKHGLCAAPADWPYSTFHRFARARIYAIDWGADGSPRLPDDVGME